MCTGVATWFVCCGGHIGLCAAVATSGCSLQVTVENKTLARRVMDLEKQCAQLSHDNKAAKEQNLKVELAKVGEGHSKTPLFQSL